MVAFVAVDAAVYAIDKPYSYHIPPEMNVRVGIRVIVPFGRSNRRTEGIVLDISEEEHSGLKAIERPLDKEPVISSEFIRMAAFLRERYFCTFYDAIKAMLPAGLWFNNCEILEQTEKASSVTVDDEDTVSFRVLSLVQDCGGKIEISSLKDVLSCDDISPEIIDLTVQKLRKLGILRSNLDFSRKVQDKKEQIVSLAVPVDEAMAYASTKQRSAPLQYEALKLLCTVGSGSVKELSYLTGANASVFRRLEKVGLVAFSEREVFRSALPVHVDPVEPFVLNDEQAVVCRGLLQQSMNDKPGSALLYGVTGSGKTAVYITLIRKMLDLGKGVLLLVPEIALTPQLIRLLVSHFGQSVAVLHSALRVSERYDEWKRIKQGNAKVVIGTRSAIFAPVADLGLIVVDEEHEHTYKSENSPRYHAREVALYRGNREHALVVLGSATPSVETMYRAKSGIHCLYRLTGRYNGKDLPDVHVVDMKQEIRNGNASGISWFLKNELEINEKNNLQSILFLNRRGAGRCMICVDCGEVPGCPRCSVSLTYHQANGRRMCHYCGWSEPAEVVCRSCGGHLKVVGTGTQRIETELKELLPETNVLRMDADTVSATNSHEAILERFRKERIPILLGTQMVTKGLNFENVTLVGVVDADMSLYVNHYRASETTFSMLTQVIGRSGRGKQAGRAVIQTMTPEHAVIKLAAAQDYDSFYEMEVGLRCVHGCPPFYDLFTVLFTGIYEEQTLASAWDFRRSVEAMLTLPEYGAIQMEILGPSPAAVARINNSYRFRLTLKCENSRQIRLMLSHLLKNFGKDKKHKGISAFADINSYE